jgi:hypothetical protein
MRTEKNIEQLLDQLSADKKPYPKGLLNARRTAYLSHVSSVAGSGLHFNGHGQGGSPHAAAPMTPVMKVVLTALIAANVALATYLAVTAYENWDKVQEFLFGGPSVSEISPVPPEALTQPPELAMTPEIVGSPEVTVSPVSTPEPTSILEESKPDGGEQVSTPEPGGKDDPGKHLGQTPHTPDEPPGQGDKEKDDKDKDKNK